MDIFGIYLALVILLITFLAMNISRLRIKHQVANGDKGNRDIKIAIRTHINSLEHIIPYSLLMFALSEQLDTSFWFIILCFGFVLVRIVHSYSMLKSRFKFRQITAGFTYLFEVVACCALLVLSL